MKKTLLKYIQLKHFSYLHVQWILCNPTLELKAEYSDILYNSTHFPGPLVCRIRQFPLYKEQRFQGRTVFVVVRKHTSKNKIGMSKFLQYALNIRNKNCPSRLCLLTDRNKTCNLY